MSRILTNSIHPRSGNQISIGRASDTVSIAGTLTYEDVTNIDSVGVVTARGGLDVGVGGTVLTTTTAGRIGIGTTNPNYELEVASPDVTTVNIKSGSNTNLGRLFFSDDDAVARGFFNYQHNDDNLLFGTAGTERLRINQTGKIGIGTTGSSDPNDGISLVQNDNIRWLSSAGNLRQAIRCTSNDDMDFYTGSDNLAARINSLANFNLGGGSCIAASSTSGDYSVDISGLRQVAGGAWRQAGLFVFYTGIDGNQSNSTTRISSIRLQGLNTWNSVSKSDIVGTESVTISNSTQSSCTLTFNVPDSNFGSVIMILNAGSGTDSFPSMTINA